MSNSTFEYIEQQLFIEYTEQYEKFYRGEITEEYVIHLEKCLETLSVLQNPDKEKFIEELYDAEDVDFEETLDTVQFVNTVLSEPDEIQISKPSDSI